jgi:hypothetical protein
VFGAVGTLMLLRSPGEMAGEPVGS